MYPLLGGPVLGLSGGYRHQILHDDSIQGGTNFRKLALEQRPPGGARVVDVATYSGKAWGEEGMQTHANYSDATAVSKASGIVPRA